MENTLQKETDKCTIYSVGNSTGYLVRGFIDKQPIYDK